MINFQIRERITRKRALHFITAFFALVMFLLPGFMPRVSAQNLYPDPSYEHYLFHSGYPRAPLIIRGVLAYAFGANNGYEGLYFNRAYTWSFYTVPNNLLGFQQPRSGNGYVGIAVWDDDLVDEDNSYIQVRLTNPMIAGHTYFVQFYANLPNTAYVAINKLGAYISDTMLTSPSGYAAAISWVTPQVIMDPSTYLADTLNWVPVYGSYHAHGGEQYVTIGNFNFTRTTGVRFVGGLNDDSFIILDDAYVADSTELHDTITLCHGDSAFIGGQWRFTSGNYHDTLANGFITTTSLVANAHAGSSGTAVIPITVCGDENFYYGDYVIRDTGYYTIRLHDVFGCDSVVALHITYTDIPTSNSYQYLHCGTDSVFLSSTLGWAHSIGTYIDTFAGSAGCDSLLRHFVFYAEGEGIGTSYTTIAHCSGDSFIFKGNTVGPGYFLDTLRIPGECDSIIAYAFNWSAHVEETVNLFFCYGDTAYFYGHPYFTDTLSSFDTLLACRTTFTVLATGAYPRSGSGTATSICSTDSVYLGGAWRNTPGIYEDTLTSIFGCDSSYYDTLSIIYPAICSNPLSITICPGDSINLRGTFRNSAGIYLTILQSAAGCDSLIYDTLATYPTHAPYPGSLVWHCPGTTVLLGGVSRMLAGLYYDTLADIHTCDSVIVDTLRDYPVYRTSGMHFYACHGMGLNIHGHYRSSSGIYADTLFSSYRCDSLLFDTLSILPIPIVPGYTVFTCPGHAVNMHGSMHTHAGEYLDTQIIAGSCDTIFRDSLINYPIYLISGINYHICPGDSIAWNGNYYSSAQLLYDSLLSFNGCDSIIVDSLKWNQLPEANAGADQQIFTGEITTLHGAGGPPFFWSNGVMDSANEVSPLADTFYVLSVINDSGCISRDTVFIRVKAKVAIVKVPDAFTPNADGLNDRFTVFAQGIKTYEISIFNRWGELIYFSNDLSELNNTGRGWDGNFLGTPQQSNTFIFLIKATGEDNKLIQEQGTLSLIR